MLPFCSLHLCTLEKSRCSPLVFDDLAQAVKGPELPVEGWLATKVTRLYLLSQGDS